MMERWLLIVHLLATSYMTGLIWFVQRVHYPLMGRVGREGYAEYQRWHMRWTSAVVIPGMLAEAGTAVWIAAMDPTALPMIGLLLLAAVWAATFAILVPCHGKLCAGFDEAVHRRLVRANWIRTAAWTARCALAATMLAR